MINIRISIIRILSFFSFLPIIKTVFLTNATPIIARADQAPNKMYAMAKENFNYQAHICVNRKYNLVGDTTLQIVYTRKNIFSSI